MSFLNALASDGLSVGLRFYTARMSRASEMAAAQAVRREEDPQQTTRMIEAEQLSKPAPPPVPKEQTPEEMAAGRAEAKAMLAADGSLGLLQAAAGEIQADRNAETGQASAGKGEESSESVAWGGEVAVGELMAGAAAAEEDPEPEEPGGKSEDDEKDADKAGGRELTEEEEEQVQKMERRDREVRTHEQAHIAAGGGLAGAASYEFQAGPDGKRYAVGGEVPINSRGTSDPEQALRDAETVKRAAMAPAEPSSQDRSVAAQASADINRLRGEVADKRRAETQGGEGENKQSSPTESSRGAESADQQNADGIRESGQTKPGTAAAMSADPAQGNASQSSMVQPKAEAEKTDQGASASGGGSMPRIKVDAAGISMPQRLSNNGDSFGSRVLGAYAAVKFASDMSSYRPALASV